MIRYIKYRRQLYIFYLVAAVLTGVMWIASENDIMLGAYLEMLLFAALVTVTVIDGLLLRRRHKELKQIAEGLGTFAGDLPEADYIDDDFRAIAEGLFRRLDDREAEFDAERRRTLEYFLLWVHQIKTPIFALRLLSESDRLTSRDADRELFRIERYVELALNYIKSADLASDMVISVCRADDVARECLKKYAPIFIAKGLRAEVKGDSIMTASDPKWLAFIIEQLLSNAVKYTDEGGVTITGEGRTLTVSDTGMGFDAEDAARVFEHGYTGANGRIDKRATGMGLYLAHKAATALHIGMTIESVRGGGTSVSLTLPDRGEVFE